MTRWKLPILTLASLLVLGAAVPASAQRSRLGPFLPTQAQLNRYGLERAWWGQATLNPSRDKVRYITIDEENLYVQATSGVVTAFDNESGRRLWAVQLGRTDQPSYPLVSNREFALVVAGMKMYAVEKFEGELQWQIELPKQPSTSPAIDAERVYVGSLDGSVHAFSLDKIHELYNERLLPQWSREAVVWRYKTPETVSTPPVSTGRVVDFASRDGSLYSVTAERREQIFQFETDAPVSAPMVKSEGRLYLASEDFNFYCLDAENGQVIWQFVTGLPIRKAPAIVGGQVFVLPERGGLYCLSKTSGEEFWWRPRCTEFLAATTERVFASDRVGNVVILDRKDGAVEGSLRLRHFGTRLTNERTDRLYVATDGGLIVCIRQQGREFPIYHKYPERRPIMPEFAPEQPPDDGQP